MKSSKIKAGTVVLRWNGVSRDKGVVFKVTKKYATILWSGVKEKVEKDTLKWQRRYDYDKEEWLWYWTALANIKETLTERISDNGNWIYTYKGSNLGYSMKYIKDDSRKFLWFGTTPYKNLTKKGYIIEEDLANSLLNFVKNEDGTPDWYSSNAWFNRASKDRKELAEDVIKWMMGPLKTMIEELELSKFNHDESLPFKAKTFGIFVEKNKKITAKSKKILCRMMDGEEFETILK